MMKARKLNEHGISEFLKFIEGLRAGKNMNTPIYLLDDDRSSAPLDISINIGEPTFSSRFEMGLYLLEIFKGHNIQPLIGESGFWSWFALKWFDQLCPIKDGIRKPSKEYNYILSSDHRHRPRHAIYMTWQLVDRYGSDVRFMLSKSPETRGELTEQIMARQDFLSSRAVVELASSLYYDPDTGIFKRGAAGRKSAGCVQRYVSWLQQLELTFDIFSTTKLELNSLLPSEFDRFKVL